MKKILILSVIITVLATSSIYAADECCPGQVQAVAAGTQTGLIAPPPIYTPFDGTTVTEVHVTDNDVLGIIKQVIPVIGQALKESSTSSMLSSFSLRASAVTMVDLNPLIEAINGVKDVRFIVVQYNRQLDINQLPKQLEAGVAKIGAFSKIASDFSRPSSGVFALYSQSSAEGSGGLVGYMYQPNTRQLIAARVIGSVDFAKLTKWAIDSAKTVHSTLTPATSEAQPQAN